ncbi:hypothetical protein LNT71_004083 [Salmonella enterica]|nr:hypothetical protein [Salmonella enterica]
MKIYTHKLKSKQAFDNIKAALEKIDHSPEMDKEYHSRIFLDFEKESIEVITDQQKFHDVAEIVAFYDVN